MNIIQGILQSMSQPPTPPHVGEVFSIWAYYVALKESRALCQLMLNHTQDPELKELVEHFINEVEEPQINKIGELMKEEGIDFPAVTADKAKGDPLEIPPGANFSEIEIANLLTVKIQGLLIAAHTGMIQAIRNDLGAMWVSFHNQLLTQAFTLKELMRKRGWLRVPPYYRAGGKPSS